MYVSRWMDLFGEDSLPEARVPLISNPMGFVIDGNFYTADALRHNFYAHRMADLADDFTNPIVCEVGGGFGGFARHLLSRPGSNFRYLDYDLPVMCIASAYYLMTALPDKRLRLFGEVDDLAEPLRDADLAILPNFALPRLGDQSVDICFNTCSFAEMETATVQEYTHQFERVCRHFILYEDHSWAGDSKYAYYQPMGGFQHWNLSAIQPAPALFKRVYKVPAPFHSDMFGEFFEWLYARRERGAGKRGSDPRYTRLVEKVEAHRLGNYVVRLLESQHVQLSSSRLRRYHVRRDIAPGRGARLRPKSLPGRRRPPRPCRGTREPEPRRCRRRSDSGCWQRRAAHDVGTCAVAQSARNSTPRTIRGPEQIARKLSTATAGAAACRTARCCGRLGTTHRGERVDPGRALVRGRAE